MAENNALNKQTEDFIINNAAGDPFVNFQIGGTNEFVIGVDDTDADIFKINQGGASPSAGTNLWKMTAIGESTMVLHPSFLASPSATQFNVTGDGTAYHVLFQNEWLDQGSDYNNTTGTFTAPVTGIYSIGGKLMTQGNAAAHTSEQISVVTSDQTFSHGIVPGKSYTAGTTVYIRMFVIAPMDAADTAYIELTVSGGAKTVDIGGGNQNTIFYGGLYC